MAILHVHKIQKRSQRRHYVENAAPGTSTPIFLGSRFGGVSYTYECTVKGSSHADAVSFLNTLDGLVVSSETVSIGPSGTIVAPGVPAVTGQLESVGYSLRPNSPNQGVSIQLRTY